MGFALSICGILSAGFVQVSGAAEDGGSQGQDRQPMALPDCPLIVATPAVMPAFIPLPPGKVEPAGWLRDWAQTIRQGITGHLDERHPTFAGGWKGIPIKAQGAQPDGTGWPIEQSAYWLDGALRLGLILHDESLIQKIRRRLDPVVEGVHKAEFGTSFIYWKPGFKPQGFDSWAHSHMGRALVALYQGSGDKRVLDALVKVYADYPENMGGLQVNDVSGLCNLDAMMETYAMSGDRRILERATAAISRAEVREIIKQWGGNTMDPSHLVITYENLRLPAVMYPWTGDPAQLRATKGAFAWLEKNHMMPYGLPSGEEYVAGVGAGRKTETCNIPAMLLAANWMYRVEGDGAWGDRMEEAFYNAGAAPLSRDGQTAAYYQAPNRIKLHVLPVESKAPTEVGGTSIAFGPLACDQVLCCIGAANRILPYFIANMWMATTNNGLAATLYGPCSVRALAGPQVPVRISCATDYPFNDSIRMTVVPEKPVAFPLYLRLPQWCAAPVVKLNGRAVKLPPAFGARSFICINRTWKPGDTVTLSTPMAVTVERGFENAYPKELRGYFGWIRSAMFKPRALPYASVHYGPLLLALPIPEKDHNMPLEGAKWQYALNLHPDDATKLRVKRLPMPKHWDWPAAAPLSLQVPVRGFEWNPTATQALPTTRVTGDSGETVTLVPYGCAKFQISMFPVTPHAWEGLAVPPPTPEDTNAPVLLGRAGIYEDVAATTGEAIGYINSPGSGVVWQGLPAGTQLKIRYAALNNAQLTLRINDGPPQKVAFPATGKWQGAGAYAEVTVPVTVPANAKATLAFETGDTPANIDSVQISDGQ